MAGALRAAAPAPGRARARGRGSRGRTSRPRPARELAPRILAKGRRVLDLSGAFRLTDPDVFKSYYRFDHPEPALLAEAEAGDLSVRDVLRAAVLSYEITGRFARAHSGAIP